MDVRDIENHRVCFINTKTGEISTKYKGFSSKFTLPVGGTYSIIRNRTETIINRITVLDYDIKSFKK